MCVVTTVGLAHRYVSIFAVSVLVFNDYLMLLVAVSETAQKIYSGAVIPNVLQGISAVASQGVHGKIVEKLNLFKIYIQLKYDPHIASFSA